MFALFARWVVEVRDAASGEWLPAVERRYRSEEAAQVAFAAFRTHAYLTAGAVIDPADYRFRKV